MKVISIDEFRSHVDEYLAAAATGDVVLVRNGKPEVLLCAASHDPDIEIIDSPEFWRMIHERRQEQAIPWDAARQQLDLDESAGGR